MRFVPQNNFLYMPLCAETFLFVNRKIFFTLKCRVAVRSQIKAGKSGIFLEKLMKGEISRSKGCHEKGKSV